MNNSTNIKSYPVPVSAFAGKMVIGLQSGFLHAGSNSPFEGPFRGVITMKR